MLIAEGEEGKGSALMPLKALDGASNAEAAIAVEKRRLGISEGTAHLATTAEDR